MRSTRKLIGTAVLAAASLLAAAPGLAQEPSADTTQEPSADAAQASQAAPPRPFGPTEIADSALATRALLREASRAVDATTDLAGISDALPGASGRIDNLERDTRGRMQGDGPSFALEQTEHAWQRIAGQLDGWLGTLSSNASAVDSVLDQIDAGRRRWEMTRDSTRAGDVPAEVTREIGQTLAAVDSVQGLVRVARDTVLRLQAAVGLQKARADQNLADLRQEISSRRGRLLRIDSPPLWKAFDRPGERRSLSERTAAVWQLNYRSVRSFLAEQQGKLLGNLAFLLVLIVILARLRDVAGTQLEQDDSLRAVAGFFDRPVAAGFFLAGLVGYLAQPSAPRAWRAMLGLVVVVAALRLLPRILTGSTRSWGYAAAALFFLQQAVELTEFGSPENRLTLLLLSLVGLGACLRLTSSKVLAQTTVSKRWSRAIDLTIRVAAIAFAGGVIANIVGSAGSATVVTTGTVHLIFAAIAFRLAAVVVLAGVRIGLVTKTASRLDIEPSNAGTVERVARSLVGWLAWIGFAATVLEGFGLLDPAVTALTDLLAAGVSVGNFSLSVGDVLVFGLVVWLSFKLSQLIAFVLGTDVLPLLHLPRGLKAAIIQMTRYAVILLGVLVAFSAAGFDVDRLTILFGALGVGVGFGLQSVVNNFASGVIVMFGQGINIGDKVQFDEHEGVVRDIGFLQSTVRTYHGADVIVPNATLLSSTVVNWTREGAAQRRVDIPVGVVYGTDPKTVIELLEGVAAKHPLVAKSPEPKAIFLEFGDSSLDFQLRVWFPADSFVGASSELRVAANDALNAAGIEIPFPQRDLHLRTIDEGVSIDVNSP